VPRLRRVAIDDPDDPRLADYRALRDAELQGAFIAEGALVVRQLLRSPYRVRSVLVTPRKLAALDADLPPDVTVYVAPRELLRAVVGFDLHRGAVAAAERPPPADAAAIARRARSLLVVEDVSDAENMGSLFRNAAAFGVDAVLLSPRCCDPLYRRAVRVSMGHVLHVPFARLAPWPSSLDDVVRAAGFTTVALTPGADAVDVDRVPPPPRPAILVGAEGPGLTDAALASADLRVRIPMRPGVDSINVAAAAAVAFHRLVVHAG
jgi:tRNA G18 (ribose-2'-O)-methylase SpoU